MKLTLTKYIIIGLLLMSFGCAKSKNHQNKSDQSTDKIVKNNIPKDSIKPKVYRMRRFANVKQFYKVLAVSVTDLCVKNNVPPAAVLAIAGLESGWNQGYVGRITGNILSLGARGGDAELPALYLPNLKINQKILFDSIEIHQYKKSSMVWKKRAQSLKKDYRPRNIAGTPYQLAYFKYHPKAKVKAQLQNVSDFLNIFIAHNSRITAYRNARKTLDSLVNNHGKDILLKQKTALYFINAIGGKPNSFNFRKTWPKKVTYIMNNVGLVPLTKSLYFDKITFEKAWEK